MSSPSPQEGAPAHGLPAPARAPGASARVSYAARIALIAGAYYVFAKIGLDLAFATTSVTAIWPPTGIALAALVIWGSEDKIIPASHASSAKGAKVEVIQGAGHMVQMEQAGKVNALIKAHIAG